MRISEWMDDYRDDTVELRGPVRGDLERMRALTHEKIGAAKPDRRPKKKKQIFGLLLAAALTAALAGGAAAVIYRLNASDYLGETVLGHSAEPDAAAQLDEIGTTEFGLEKDTQNETALPSVTSNGITLTPLAAIYDGHEFYFRFRFVTPENLILPTLGENEFFQLSDGGNAAGLDFACQGAGWMEENSVFTRVDDHTLEYTGNYTFTDCTALESVRIEGLWRQNADKGYTQVFAGEWTLSLSGLKQKYLLFDAEGKQFQLYVKPVENNLVEDDWPGGNVTMTLTSDLELTPLGIYCDYDEYPPELAGGEDAVFRLRSFGALCKIYYTDGTEGEVPYDLSRVKKVVVWDQLELFAP